MNCTFRAVQFTRAAFHAEILMLNPSLPAFYKKNIVRTNHGAHPATVAFFFIQFKCDDTFQINQCIHSYINLEMIQPKSPIPAKVICSGKAVFISF